MGVKITGNSFLTTIECKNVARDYIIEAVHQFDVTPNVEIDNEARGEFCKIIGTVWGSENWFSENGSDDRKINMTAYIVSNGYSYYTIALTSEIAFVGRRTYHESHNPFLDDEYWEKAARRSYVYENEDKYHVDDLVVVIDSKSGEYAIEQNKHLLFPSTFFRLCTNSKSVEKFINGTGPLPQEISPEDKEKLFTPDLSHLERCKILKRVNDNNEIPDLLAMTKSLIDELKSFEGVDEVVDLSIFSLIPAPEKAKARFMATPQ